MAPKSLEYFKGRKKNQRFLKLMCSKVCAKLYPQI